MPYGEEINGVVQGSDDFLFHCYDSAFEQLCSDNEPADHPLKDWVSVFERDFAWCMFKRTRFVTLIVPERHVIYADKLPANRSVSQRRPINWLLNAIDPTMRTAVLYPERQLIAERAQGEVYYKTDEHLNLHGQQTCYRALVDHLGPAIMAKLPQHDAPIVKIRVHASGNLGMRLDTEPMEDMEGYGLARNGSTRRIFRNPGGRDPVEVFERDDHCGPKAIIFGDSHIDQLRYLLIPHFSRTVIMYGCNRLFDDLVRSEQPDLVVHVMSELSLRRPPVLQVTDFLSYCGEQLPVDRPLLAIDFGTNGRSEEFMGEGWSFTEETHTWMTGTTSTLKLPKAVSRALAGEAGNRMMSLSLFPLVGTSVHRRTQRLTISYDDNQILGFCEIDKETELNIPLPQLRFPSDGVICLKFEHPDGFAPKNEGQIDDRVMSVAVRRLSISKIK